MEGYWDDQSIKLQDHDCQNQLNTQIYDRFLDWLINQCQCNSHIANTTQTTPQYNNWFLVEWQPW